MSENYRVGQVLYVIPVDTTSVIPVQIIERKTSETTSGVRITHTVKSPKTETKPMILETIKGSIFSSLASTREAMIKNATTAINSMIKHAGNVAQQAFNVSDVEQQVDQFDIIEHKIENEQLLDKQSDFLSQDLDQDNMIEIMGPDGKTQRVKVRVNT